MERCENCYYALKQVGDDVICDILNNLLKNKDNVFDPENQKLYRFISSHLKLDGVVSVDKEGNILINKEGSCMNYHKRR